MTINSWHSSSCGHLLLLNPEFLMVSYKCMNNWSFQCLIVWFLRLIFSAADHASTTLREAFYWSSFTVKGLKLAENIVGLRTRKWHSQPVASPSIRSHFQAIILRTEFEHRFNPTISRHLGFIFASIFKSVQDSQVSCILPHNLQYKNLLGMHECNA